MNKKVIQIGNGIAMPLVAMEFYKQHPELVDSLNQELKLGIEVSEPSDNDIFKMKEEKCYLLDPVDIPTKKRFGNYMLAVRTTTDPSLKGSNLEEASATVTSLQQYEELLHAKETRNIAWS